MFGLFLFGALRLNTNISIKISKYWYCEKATAILEKLAPSAIYKKRLPMAAILFLLEVTGTTMARKTDGTASALG